MNICPDFGLVVTRQLLEASEAGSGHFEFGRVIVASIACWAN
jgi:hypothetical protein